MRPCCTPNPPADRGRRPGPSHPVASGVLLSLALHGLVVTALLVFAGSALPPCEFPTVLLEMHFPGLGGEGCGGDGPPGGGNGQPGGRAQPLETSGLPDAAAAPAPEAPSPEAPDPSEAPSRDMRAPLETVPEHTPEQPPDPVMPHPEPAATPPPRTKRPSKPAPPPRKSRRASQPITAPAEETAPSATPVLPASQAGLGPGSQGTGPGRGLGAGSGTGGAPGAGNGAGCGEKGAGQGVYGDARFGDGEGPRFVKLVQPRYPAQAKAAQKEGGVLLRLTIDASGHLQHAAVVRGGGADFDEAALEAVKKSTYFPATLHGRHVGCRALLYIQFKLSSP